MKIIKATHVMLLLATAPFTVRMVKAYVPVLRRLPNSCQLDNDAINFFNDLGTEIGQAVEDLQLRMADFERRLLGANSQLLESLGIVPDLGLDDVIKTALGLLGVDITGNLVGPIVDAIDEFTAEVEGLEAVRPANYIDTIRGILTLFQDATRISYKALNRLRTCMGGLTQEALGINPEPIDRTTLVKGKNISKVVANFRSITNLEITIRGIELAKTQLKSLGDLVSKICTLFPNLDKTLAGTTAAEAGVGVAVEAGGETGVEYSEEKGCKDIYADPLSLAVAIATIGIDSLLELLKFLLFIDTKYNGLVNFQYDQATYENVLLLVESGKCIDKGGKGAKGEKTKKSGDSK